MVSKQKINREVKENEQYPKVAIIVLNWNGWQDTIECLESVFQNSYSNYQVIVIDNGSTDGSEDKIRAWAGGKIEVKSPFIRSTLSNKPIPLIRYESEMGERGGDTESEKSLYTFLKASVPHPLILIQTGSNLGYAGGNNIGLRYALRKGDGAFIWILNNDTVIEKDALKELMNCVQSDSSIGMIGSKLLYYGRPNVLQSAGGCRISPIIGNTRLIGLNHEDNGDWDKPLEPDYICGASLLVKKKVIEDIGLMDEDYFLYWDDADWGIRARRKGYRLLYCPKSRVWHKEGGTSGGINPATDYYWTRNGLLFIKKFYPFLLPLIPFSYLMKFTIVRTIKRQPLNLKSFVKGFIDFIKGKTGKEK